MYVENMACEKNYLYYEKIISCCPPRQVMNDWKASGVTSWEAIHWDVEHSLETFCF